MYIRIKKHINKNLQLECDVGIYKITTEFIG